MSQKQLAEQVRRFRRDIEALDVAGTHPHLVTAYDFFKDERSDEFYYLILEWVADKTLADLLAHHDTVSLPTQITWMKQLASALSHVHCQGVVHRNLTPENIYLAGEGTVKLGNFDFARVPALGQTISVTGIPSVRVRYAAPEVLSRPHEVDGRADIYALGAIWFDLLVPGPTDQVIDPVHLQSIDLPAEIRAVLTKMLAKRRAERYESAAALMQDLQMLSAFVA